jgi:hypothetical protein
MDDPGTLRRMAARYFANAASSATPEEDEKLNEAGRQLELWADDLEEINAADGRKASEPGNEWRPEANGLQPY